MSEYEVVFGFKENPEDMVAIEATDKTVDQILEENNFKAHAVETVYADYPCYILVQTYRNSCIDTFSFEDLTTAKLNMNLRSKTDFIFDGDMGCFIDLGILHWEDRHKAKSVKTAAKYIASRLSELFYKIDKKDAAELKAYATKHDIPLNLDVFKEFQKQFKAEHPNWDSSDGRCPW